MPELPEVESTVRYLRERVLGLTITDAHVYWHRSAVSYLPAPFEKALPGFHIQDVFRRGKYIGLQSSDPTPRFLFVHLRMSGSLDVVSAKLTTGPHDRVILPLSNGKSIRFNDTRKFGRIYLCHDSSKVVGKLGIEPLSKDFVARHLHTPLRRRKTRIKPLLLDQTVIAGLGNIYVDECLWKARIHPHTPAEAISWVKCEALYTAIQETLSSAIKLAGTDFGDGVVEGGMYSPLVYGRSGDACERCSRAIKRIVVGQRGTHFCPNCQRLSPTTTKARDE